MLEHLLSDELLRELERFVDRRVDERVAELERERRRDDWLPLAEAAELLGCTPVALRDRIRRRVIPASTMSRRLYVKRSDIYAELERKRR